MLTPDLVHIYSPVCLIIGFYYESGIFQTQQLCNLYGGCAILKSIPGRQETWLLGSHLNRNPFCGLVSSKVGPDMSVHTIWWLKLAIENVTMLKVFTCGYV